MKKPIDRVELFFVIATIVAIASIIYGAIAAQPKPTTRFLIDQCLIGATPFVQFEDGSITQCERPAKSPVRKQYL